MRKIFFALLVCFVSFFPLTTAMATESILFASNTVLSEAYLTLNSTDTRAQTITAAVDNITTFYAYLNDRVGGSTITGYLINEASQEVVKELSHRMDDGDGWEEFYFNTAVDKESVYRVKILVPSASGVKWVRSGDVYSGGWYYYGDDAYDLSSDMVFQAWGYDNPVVDDGTDTGDDTVVPTPTTPGTPATDSTTSTDTLSTTSETPAASVSATIAKPTDLKAAYDKTVILSWKASTTTDIDGYKVFRSETKGKDYSKVGQTEKAVVSYSDGTVTAGKTYYYVVRAYKGSSQSASSDEASILVPEKEDAPATASTNDIASDSDEHAVSTAPNYLLYILAIAASVLTLILLILIKRRDNKTKKNKDTNSPAHDTRPPEIR